MVQLSRLRLSGFKSFVDKTELDIGNGLNGIVGPNGCGKSNLVEALRWVMGENRARTMRGDGMEDVIFNGTAARPARNIAEVTLLIDNSDGSAPLPFGNTAQIEVTRRIERGKGSHYLVNGKAVRARDVQILFADALTGAHSPALVSQGRVAQIIQAKPTERRTMLEESAGVAALYTRRREAELRLTAADENLSKLDLVIGEMQSRANSLRNQARQALRYSDLSDTIRRLDMVLAWQDWVNTREKLRKEEGRFVETDKDVQTAMLRASELTRAAEIAIETAEESRKADIEARATLQLLKQKAETIEREIQHRKDEYLDITRQISQNEQDEKSAVEQAAALTERMAVIANDLEKIASEEGDNPAGIAALEESFTNAQAAQREAENAVLSLQESIRRAQMERDMAARDLDRASSERDRLASAIATYESDFNMLSAPNDDEAQLAAVKAKLEASRNEREGVEAAVVAAQDTLDATRSELSAARDAVAALRQEQSATQRELKSASDLLERLSQGAENSLILSLDVPADIAPALARAAGELATLAATDETAAYRWSGQGTAFTTADWPSNVQMLSDVVSAPAELKPFLSSVALVDSVETGHALAASLKQGQMLVTREGAVWRWDGLVAAASESESREVQILSLRQLVKDSQDTLNGFAPQIETAEAAQAKLETAKTEWSVKLTDTQSALKELSSKINRAENSARQLEEATAQRTLKRNLAEGRLSDARAKADEIAQSVTDAQEALEALNNAEQDAERANALTQAEATLATAREVRDATSSKLESARAAAAQIRQLQDNLAREQSRTQDQLSRTSAQVETLQARLVELQARREALRPQVIADESGQAMQTFLDQIASGEELLTNTSDAFAVADQSAKQLTADLRKVEQDSVDLRERRAVIQATVQALQNEQTRIAGDIEERFSVSPAALESTVMTEWPEGAPSVSKARAERDFLNRERDAMGPVNLRAQVELDEIEANFGQMETEKGELTEAIARLREGIDKLNVEARERITKTFADVNAHFQDLFKRLFGGGEAHLKMIDSEDPLEAGLEIFAQPPGKTLQSLTLLSGGEQTLTALAMIFAMFLSNPAPVCVLDEVDAPLDDANVDRVCTMLEEMAAKCDTRFLVITHHRMTMARMKRLYGVTMAERGISQLVSVNLALQGDLLAEGHTQAA